MNKQPTVGSYQQAQIEYARAQAEARDAEIELVHAQERDRAAWREFKRAICALNVERKNHDERQRGATS